MARNDPDNMLLQGALLIAKLDNPDIDVDAYVARVGEMGKEISEKLRGPMTQILSVMLYHTYLFQENGFHWWKY